MPESFTRSPEHAVDFDVLVVGAGFAGMYMLYRLRRLGFSALVIEAGSDVGGTWFWNRYPGARCDVESVQYSYQFDRELEQEWTWSEKYSPQPEILAYANHVADRYDLRRDIRFNCRVTAAHYQEDRRLWEVTLAGDERISARHVVMATGCLSLSNTPDFAGIHDFRGATYHTGRWPHEGVDFTGQRVGVIGTGSSAIQSIPVIARQARTLTVFQRTANYTIPARNAPLSPAYVERIKASYPELRARARSLPTGYAINYNTGSVHEVSREEYRAEYRQRWEAGGVNFLAAYGDLLFDAEANRTAADFVKDMIRETVHDPETAELLCPTNIIGCKRLCVDTDYYATYNLPHVRLIDVSHVPIDHLTPDGLVHNDTAYEFDAIVFATGFDAMTGALFDIDIRGTDGISLREKWQDGPRTYLGLTTAGFPNLFTVTGPGSPSVLTNMLPSIEQHVNWIADCLAWLRDRGHEVIDASPEAELAWGEHVNEVAAASLRSTCASWYVGANVPGKPRVFMPYIGGFPRYVAKCDEVASRDYEGFALA